MSYRIEFKSPAAEDFSRLDKAVAGQVLRKLRWLAEHLDEITLEPLVGNLKGLYKLRSGDYRILYSVHEERQLIVVHMVGHRREIYR